MPTRRVKDTDYYLKGNVSYAPSGLNDIWTKTGGGNAYNAGVQGQSGLATPNNDQSVRLLLRSIAYGVRFGFANFPSPVGNSVLLGWEFIPDRAAIDVLADDFSTDFGTPDYDTTKWGVNGSPGSIVVSGGELSITASSSSGLRSVNTYDFTSKSVSAKVPVITSNANIANGFLISATDAFSTYWGIDEYNGQLRCTNQNSLISSIAYNATNHLYKRIRFSGTTVYFDTSPDGSTWTNVTSATSTVTRTALYVYLRPYFAANLTAKYDDVKVTEAAVTKKFQVIEQGTIKFTSSRVPSVDDELRVQLIYESGVLKGKYWWRDDSGSSEQLEYTSVLSGATLESLFPLLAKGEIYESGGELANLQLEGDTFTDAKAKGEANITKARGVLKGLIVMPKGGADSMQYIYTGGNLVNPQTGLSYFRASGNPIKTIRIWTSQPNTLGDTVFNVQKNGANLFAGAARPKILQNQNFVELSGLNITTAVGDLIQLSLETVPSGFVYTPITFEVGY